MTVTSAFDIVSYLDGDNEPEGYRAVVKAFEDVWTSNYGNAGTPRFVPPVNVKQGSERVTLPTELARIASIRNPDFFFAVPKWNIELGGVEITGHSPDGSNVEKRYPFLWASRRGSTDAFIASFYLKKRPGGQINRLPYRHAHRNSIFIDEWTPGATSLRPLCQIVPIRELHMEDLGLVPANIQALMLSWADIGGFFAHSLACRMHASCAMHSPQEALIKFKQRLMNLAIACKANTTDTDASSLIKEDDRWIQVYNTRPDSGHWERGEGQFDSIDGRLMFTLDEIASLSKPPARFEFWLPQMVSTHPWIAEQRARQFASKRLRNILVVLKDVCGTKFGDQLDDADWRVLQRNSRLLLERLDWSEKIYRVDVLAPPGRVVEIAREGMTRRPPVHLQAIEKLLRTPDLYFSAHRPYTTHFAESIGAAVSSLPANSVVLVPRIPRKMLSDVTRNSPVRILAAEDMTKEHLMMLRQLHRQGVPACDGV